MDGLSYVPPRPPRIWPCGIPECRICRWNDEHHQVSDRPDDSVAELLVSAAAIVILIITAFVLLPVLA